MNKSHYEVQITEPRTVTGYKQNRTLHVLSHTASKAIELVIESIPDANVINVLHRGTFNFIEE